MLKLDGFYMSHECLHLIYGQIELNVVTNDEIYKH